MELNMSEIFVGQNYQRFVGNKHRKDLVWISDDLFFILPFKIAKSLLKTFGESVSIMDCLLYSRAWKVMKILFSDVKSLWKDCFR